VWYNWSTKQQGAEMGLSSFGQFGGLCSFWRRNKFGPQPKTPDLGTRASHDIYLISEIHLSDDRLIVTVNTHASNAMHRISGSLACRQQSMQRKRAKKDISQLRYKLGQHPDDFNYEVIEGVNQICVSQNIVEAMRCLVQQPYFLNVNQVWPKEVGDLVKKAEELNQKAKDLLEKELSEYNVEVAKDGNGKPPASGDEASQPSSPVMKFTSVV